ncbi:NAD(P)-dependent oxidoreductase [Lichenifustis flavocetrariae]|uniref:precorrin-2 dehydrogenase n=1 Tax=Lichenifustis flavocetrariae TaxID=2949735 RepID=A0AA41YX99_9HYPH|nr:NAD(P)-dependent oxidoreductase [Lichenifustis flavocetrariae]MCW6506535.1 SAM-dependent methyltransferase [Lichenifustis flavocetrariae]
MSASITPPVGLERLPTLPIFFKLAGRRVVIAGGTEPAVWKAEVLAAAGALVDVVAEQPCDGLEALAEELGPKSLRLIRRSWQAADLEGAALAIGAIEEEGEAERFRQAAGAKGVPVNIIDKPAYCEFQFGTIIARSPVVIAITTDGAAPVFGQALRARIEAILPSGLRAWAQAAKDWRPLVAERNWDFRRRRRFWEVFTDRVFQSEDRAPTAADLTACFAETDDDRDQLEGRITLVGAGPGDVGSLTFAATRALQSADLVIYDADVPSETVNLTRREARKIAVPESETEAAAFLLDEVQKGRRIVWLGTGDPDNCAHWDRRAAELERNEAPCSRLSGLGRCPRCSGRCRM